MTKAPRNETTVLETNGYSRKESMTDDSVKRTVRVVEEEGEVSFIRSRFNYWTFDTRSEQVSSYQYFLYNVLRT